MGGFNFTKARKITTKAGPKSLEPLKRVAHEMLPTRDALSTITRGSAAQRSMNNYAKQSPLDANGLGSIGQNILKKG